VADQRRNGLTSARIAARPAASLALVAILTTAILVGTAGPASAHEQRRVGQLNFVVGFGEEPAYAGLPNSVQLRLSDAKEKPVTDLAEGALSVEVTFGDQTTKLSLEPRFVVGVFGDPGDYRANFVPSRPGQYKFRFTGTVAGQQVDETFTSGPETFNDVEDGAEQMFPVRDPSTGQLAERLEREVARLESANANANASDGTARVLGIAGIVVAVAAIAVSLLTLRRRA
jgi:hypothetical protein